MDTQSTARPGNSAETGDGEVEGRERGGGGIGVEGGGGHLANAVTNSRWLQRQ